VRGVLIRELSKKSSKQEKRRRRKRYSEGIRPQTPRMENGIPVNKKRMKSAEKEKDSPGKRAGSENKLNYFWSRRGAKMQEREEANPHQNRRKRKMDSPKEKPARGEK